MTEPTGPGPGGAAPAGPDFGAQAVGLPRVAATTYATVPADLARHTTPSAWAVEQGRPELIGSFLEGPVFDSAGDLWLCDVARGRILRLDAVGDWHVAAEYDGAPNGLAFDPAGRLLIADHHRGLLALDESGQVRPLITRYGLNAFTGLNDVCVAPGGAVYFTDQGGSGLHDPRGRLFRLGRDGTVKLLVGTMPSPNAVTLSATGDAAFVAVTRDNAIWRVPLRDDGEVAKVGRFIALSGGGGPDGVTALPGGGLVVTHLGLGVVWCFDRRGIPVLAVDTPQGEDPTNSVVDPRCGALLITEAASGSVLRVSAEQLKGAL